MEKLLSDRSKLVEMIYLLNSKIKIKDPWTICYINKTEAFASLELVIT